MSLASFAASPANELLHVAQPSAVHGPPGLSSSTEEVAAAVTFPAMQKGEAIIHASPGLDEPLDMRAAWRGGLVCETDASTTDTSASEFPSPTTSESTEEPTAAAATEEEAAKVVAGYVPGRILQQAITQATAPAIPLCLEDTGGRTTTGSPDCPSVGSAGHWLGMCKPCDFFHRDRCTNEAACKYCHLCGPEEGKHRRKQKQALIKVAKCWQRNHVTVAAWGSTQA